MDSFKKKLLLEIGIALGIIAVLAGGIFFFAGAISDYSDQIVSLRTRLANQASSLAALASLRADYNSVVKQDLQALNGAVPYKDQLINLTKEFQLLAAQNGLSSSFAFIGETPAAGGSFGTIRFKLEVSGDFNKLPDFVAQLQHFTYLSTFDSFSITRGTGSSGVLSTAGQVYYREQP